MALRHWQQIAPLEELSLFLRSVVAMLCIDQHTLYLQSNCPGLLVFLKVGEKWEMNSWYEVWLEIKQNSRTTASKLLNPFPSFWVGRLFKVSFPSFHSSYSSWLRGGVVHGHLIWRVADLLLSNWHLLHGMENCGNGTKVTKTLNKLTIIQQKEKSPSTSMIKICQVNDKQHDHSRWFGSVGRLGGLGG